MVKRKRANIRSKPAAAAAGGIQAVDDKGREDGPDWTSVQGRRLDVDIAANDGEDVAPPSKKRPSRATADAGEDDEFDAGRWRSRHYDDESDDDGHASRRAESELFDPDPDARANKFDAGNKVEGANDAGMFLSLEVIPADSYRVEKIGDEKGGFLTKVVFAKDQENQASEPTDVASRGEDATRKAPEKKSKTNLTEQKSIASKANSEASDGLEAKLTKKERQKLKQKEKREKAKERKRVKRELEGATSTDTIDESSQGPKGPASAALDEGEANLTKKERQKIKRKAKVEQAKERKRVKKESEDATSQDTLDTLSQKPKCVESATSSAKAAGSDKSQIVQEDNAESSSQEEGEVTQLQTTWSISAPGVTLHRTLCEGLHSLGYSLPTPIQSASLPAAILGRRDIVGAAPTGSGKTLSYGLPILQWLLGNNDGGEDDVGQDQEQQQGQSTTRLPLQALILTPTRELAMQVSDELKRVCRKAVAIGTITGGFAEVKQRRTLEKVRPPILVATPGRLWEMMSSREYSHLNNLTQLCFLVIDEADRMIQQGNFPQLQQIFEVINQANPPPEDAEESDDESEEDDDDDNRLRSLRGVRGEAKVVMLDDSILAAIERERSSDQEGNVPAPMEMDDEEYDEQLVPDEEDDSDGSIEEEMEPVHRQTFVYSATLTLPPSMHHLIKRDPSAKAKRTKSRKGKKKQATTVDGAITEILDAAGARGETKVVDLSNTVPEGKKKKAKPQKEAGGSKQENVHSVVARRLPPGLTLGEVRCAQRHKDSHLYAYLVTTRQGSSGPCLVFCNSIAAVRRVGETLKTLGLPVRMLHAQMVQKSRLSALEYLRTTNTRSIVVASDVAARGLDIPSVTTVIHYDVARVVDTFIHRAGRTARGVGENAVGTSISLVAPAEEREHQKICEAVRGEGSKSLSQVHIDSHLLTEAQTRVALATKIVSCDDIETQTTRKNKWLQDAAKDAGLEVDEDMMEDGLLDGDRRDRQRFIEAKRAKGQLRQLLAKPMRKQHFGKFLSGVGLRESIKAESEVKPFVVNQSVSKGKQRRKKHKLKTIVDAKD